MSRTQEIARLKRQERLADRAGWPDVALSYRVEQMELERERVACPACEGAGTVERFFDSRLINCRVCDGDGTVRPGEEA